jgi:hypothetical protein
MLKSVHENTKVDSIIIFILYLLDNFCASIEAAFSSSLYRTGSDSASITLEALLSCEFVLDVYVPKSRVSSFELTRPLNEVDAALAL